MFKEYVHEALVKPAITAVICYVGNKFILNESSMTRNLQFSGTVFGALVLADTVANYALPKTHFRSLEEKIMEVAGGVGGVFILDKMTNQGNRNQLERYGLVVGSQILADYIKEIILNDV